MSASDDLYQLLRAALWDPFRLAILEREYRRGDGLQSQCVPEDVIADVAYSFVHSTPEMQDRIFWAMEGAAPEDVRYIVPDDVLEDMLVRIGQTVWKHRYAGPSRVIVRIRQSSIEPVAILHPESPSLSSLPSLSS